MYVYIYIYRLSIFPNRIRCIAFAPPCIISHPASLYTRDIITSVVYNDDVVSRLGLGSCLELRDACILLYDRPMTTSTSVEDGVQDDVGANNNTNHTSNDSNILELNTQVREDNAGGENVRGVVELSMKEIRARKSYYHKLYPAGNILHVISRPSISKSIICTDMHTYPSNNSIYTTSDNNNNNSNTNTPSIPELSKDAIIINHPQYVVYQAHPYTFNEMILSSTMFSDHMPQQCLYICKEVFV